MAGAAKARCLVCGRISRSGWILADILMDLEPRLLKLEGALKFLVGLLGFRFFFCFFLIFRSCHIPALFLGFIF